VNIKNHSPRNFRGRIDGDEIILVWILEKALTKFFEGYGIVHNVSHPLDTVWRINFLSRGICGFIKIHRVEKKISCKFYANGHDPERFFGYDRWHDVAMMVACQAHQTYYGALQILDEVVSSEKSPDD